MPADSASRQFAITAARAAAEKSAHEIVALDVADRLAIVDAFVIASGSNERHVKAIVDGVAEAMHEAGAGLRRREGRGEARWVLLDFGALIVHIQHAEDRDFYGLERLWKDCPAIELPADVTDGAGSAETPA